MTTPPATRRNFLASAAALSAISLGSGSPAVAVQREAPTSSDTGPGLRFCLNMSTINGGEIPLRQQLQIASEAGYDAVELWLRDIEKFVGQGGKLVDLRNEINDLGLGVDSAIAFGQWIVDDEQQRTKGLEQSKRDMDTLRSIGGRRIAAPPVGATNEAGLDLDAAAERYRQLLEIGRASEVTPQLELWGFSKNVSTLAEVLYIAAAANHPDACLLLDVYHLYKGGADFANIGLVPGKQMHVLHMNDYPDMPRDQIGDQDRVYPGDGVAPLDNILKSLIAGGFQGTLSLELFNRTYWAQPPQQVARTGLEKMKASLHHALA